jgi:hypothetical protein
MWFELGHYIVWYIHGYECFGGAFWVCLHEPSLWKQQVQAKLSVDNLDYTVL